MAMDYRSMAMERHCEVWDGVQDIREPAATFHEDVVGKLFVMADITYVSNSNRSIIQPKGIFGVPDLTVEVVSPDIQNTKRDIVDKKGFCVYAEAISQEIVHVAFLTDTELFSMNPRLCKATSP